MKILLGLTLIFLSMNAVGYIADDGGSKLGDAVTVDSKTHMVLFENDHVRVFRVLASAGRTTARHTHLQTVLVSLERARFRQTDGDRAVSVIDLRAGDVLWLDKLDHSWELLAGDAHVIGIEVKDLEDGLPKNLGPLPESDALIVDPDHHQLVLENDHVRVFKALARTGAVSPMHSHPPLVLISLGTARVDVRMGDGATMLHDLLPGQVVWIGGEHSWEVYAGMTHVVAVEVKRARSIGAHP